MVQARNHSKQSGCLKLIVILRCLIWIVNMGCTSSYCTEANKIHFVKKPKRKSPELTENLNKAIKMRPNKLYICFVNK